MNTDRELLELAAKAAGFTTSHKWNTERLTMDPPVTAMVVHRNGELVTTGWNPLADDGDALRLAVKLGIIVCVNYELGYCGIHFPRGRGKYDLGERLGTDPYAATRRAIVRAAAEIGRAMP